jgi:hypothetical protein
VAETHIGPLPEGTKSCRVCAEPINKAAQKCIHCQSEQSWVRQRLGLSSTVLSLLVALISVLTASVPILMESLATKNAKLSFTFLSADDQYIVVFVTNAGTRPGTISQVSVIVGEGVLQLTTGSPAPIIEPGRSYLLQFRSPTPIARTSPLIDMWEEGPCSVAMRLIDFHGSPKAEYHEVSCRELGRFFGKPPEAE